jgi:YbgC/YbaW family acyl-CoA thioester hydrolase
MSASFTHRVPVRFRDCDPLGHVNNAVYLTYLEETRFAHWRAAWGFGTAGQAPEVPGVILARIEIDYRAQARFGDVLEIRMQVASMGRSSFTYEYEVADARGATIATAKSVMVMFDYTAQRTVPIPESVRALLSR